jgi:hypothetical protein
MTGHSELIRDRVRARREELATHNIEAVNLTGVVLAAMHDAAYGRVPSIRCDRQARYRGMQLAGEKSLPLEDLVAIQLEGPGGAAVALAALRILAARLGFNLVAADAQPTMDAHESLAQLIEQSAETAADLSRALKDHDLAPGEAAELQPGLDRLEDTVQQIRAIAQQRTGALRLAK